MEEFEAFAKKYLLTDIYGFYSSGSIIGLQQTLQENTSAYTRYVRNMPSTELKGITEVTLSKPQSCLLLNNYLLLTFLLWYNA